MGRKEQWKASRANEHPTPLQTTSQADTLTAKEQGLPVPVINIVLGIDWPTQVALAPRRNEVGQLAEQGGTIGSWWGSYHNGTA